MERLDNFDSTLEISSMTKNYQAGLAAGLSETEAAEAAFKENTANLVGFQWEYLLKLSVLPNPAKIAEKDGINRLLNAKSGLALVDITNDFERKGNTKKAVIEAERLLLEAQKGDMVVIPSPAGHSQDSKGNPVDLPKAEYFAFKKKADGELEALTFVLEMTVEDNVRLLRRWNVSNEEILKEKNHDDWVASISGLAVPLPATTEKEYQFEDIAKDITEAKKHPLSNKIRAEMNDLIARREELFQVDTHCEGYIGQFQRFFLANLGNLDSHFTRRRLEGELDKTVLKIADSVFGKGESNWEDPYWAEIRFRQMHEVVQALEGCNGGGRRMEMIETPFGYREILPIPIFGKDEKCQRCPKTGKEVVCGLCKNCAQSYVQTAAS